MLYLILIASHNLASFFCNLGIAYSYLRLLSATQFHYHNLVQASTQHHNSLSIPSLLWNTTPIQRIKWLIIHLRTASKLLINLFSNHQCLNPLEYCHLRLSASIHVNTYPLTVDSYKWTCSIQSLY
jgi:hypothetical protein